MIEVILITLAILAIGYGAFRYTRNRKKIQRNRRVGFAALSCISDAEPAKRNSWRSIYSRHQDAPDSAEEADSNMEARSLINVIKDVLYDQARFESFLRGESGIVSKVKIHLVAERLAGAIRNELAKTRDLEFGVMLDEIERLRTELIAYQVMDSEGMAVAVDYAHDVIKLLLLRQDEPRVEFSEQELADAADTYLIVDDTDEGKILYVKRETKE